MPKANVLRPKHKIFCEEYIKTLNATQSYLKAFNSTYNTAKAEGYKLLARPCIQEYINKRMENVEKQRIADANEILEFLTSTIRGEVKDQLGFETSVKDRIKASELLGKRYRLFEEEKQKEEEKSTSKPKIEINIVDNSNLEQVLYENKDNT